MLSVRSLLILWLVFVAGLLWSPSIAAASDRGEDVWFGPVPFNTETRTLRDDFLPMMLDTDQWPEVFARTDVFKSYIMILPDVPPPGRTEPELSDDDIRALIALFDQHGIQIAFEVGGARSRVAGAGVAAADGEFQWLSRWIDLGGSIDFLTTDHSIAFAIEAWLDTIDPAVSGAMTYATPEVNDLIHDVCVESALYFERMAQLIPGVRFGAIESLGYWYVEHGGDVYEPTRIDLPDMPFDEVFPHFLEVMTSRSQVLDHFHTDFGWRGVAHDGGSTTTFDYGRILGVESTVQSLGVKSGNIVNAYHDIRVTTPTPAVASAEAFDRTVAFFEGYVATGQPPDHMVLQTWHPFPDHTGPETTTHTVMNMHRTLLLHDDFPTDTGFLRVNVAPTEAIDDGAMWSADGGVTWYEPGTIGRGAKGPITITLKWTDGWVTPHPIPINLSGNTTVIVDEQDATYLPWSAAEPSWTLYD